MSSNAKIIKDSFKELLEDYQPRSRTELFRYAREKNRNLVFSEGMLTGALKTLTDEGSEYVCVSRAVYQRKRKERVEKTSTADGVIAEYITILQNTVKSMECDVCVSPFELLNMSDNEKQRMKKIQSCMEYINRTLAEISN